MIYTITLNPAIDYYIELRHFQEKDLNSSEKGYSLMGGKGINVSKVLHNFGKTSLALGFIGGYTGDYIQKSFHLEGMKENFTLLTEDSRINIKMKTEEGETEIAGKSPNISPEELEDFYGKLQQIQKGDTLVLAGSVPNTLQESIYADIIERIPEGVQVILDSRGEAFRLAVQKGVFLTKPNQKELEEYFQREIHNVEELIAAGKELQKDGSENVVISMGKEGSLWIGKEKILIGNAPKGKLISSVGAGDSMVAGILYALEEGKDFEEAYRYGIAAGSSTAFSQGLTNLENMEFWKKQVELKEYN